MNRSAPLKRTGFKRKVRPVPLVPRAVGKSAVSKGPARDKAHLAKVRTLPCVVCQFPPPSEAHHLRIGLRTMGVRQSDRKTVPLCRGHHRQLHQGREESFWESMKIDPLKWCEQFGARV